ncbi:MAG: DUF503 domain-containing protein [Myxococcota bacterium]
MFVGVCRLALSLPGVSSLKEKRSIVRKVVDRTRGRFNVAVAEVEALDVHQRAVIGFAVLANEAAHCDRMVEEIASFVERLKVAPIEWRKTQRLSVGDSAEVSGDPLGDWGAFEDAS